MRGIYQFLKPAVYEDRIGRCYELAAEFVCFGDPDAVLVHGTIQCSGHDPNPHAWVELPDGSVYDAVLDQVFSKGGYEKWANARPRIRYTEHETRRLARRHEHWGPWDQEEENEHLG